MMQVSVTKVLFSFHAGYVKGEGCLWRRLWVVAFTRRTSCDLGDQEHVIAHVEMAFDDYHLPFNLGIAEDIEQLRRASKWS